MKKLNVKTIGIAAAAAALFVLAGCGESGTASVPPESLPAQELAAPQVGVLRRAVLVLETNVPEGEQPYVIELINPEIIESSGEQYGPEGCLSVPGRYGLVERPMEVTVRAQDRDGKSFEVHGTGLTARAFCHELDHLEGVVFTSRADRMLTDEELETGSWMDDEDAEEESE